MQDGELTAIRTHFLIYWGNEDSMSGRWFEYRGRPVPDAGSQPATVLQVLVRAGVGEGRTTVEAG